MTAQLKPMYNLDAEQIILGMLMADENAFSRIPDGLEPADFYEAHHQNLFKLLKHRHIKRQPHDVMVIADLLIKRGKAQDVGGDAYLFTLVGNFASGANSRHYAQLILDHSQRRKIAASGLEMAAKAQSGDDVADIVDAAQHELLKICAPEVRKWQGSAEAVTAFTEKLERLFAGEDTREEFVFGVRELDEAVHIERTNLVFIGARPGMGKTVMGLQMAIENAKLGHKAHFVSLEMSNDEVVGRALSYVSKVPSAKFRNPQGIPHHEFDDLAAAMGMIGRWPLTFYDPPTLSLFGMMSYARKQAAQKNIDMLIVDYWQLMKGQNGQKRNEQLEEISRGAKEIAKELGIVVVMLGQLNREAVGTPNGSQFLWSDAPKQDANIIILPHRPIVENTGFQWPDYAGLIVDKNRQGRSGFTVSARYTGEFFSFSAWDGEAPREEPQQRTKKQQGM